MNVPEDLGCFVRIRDQYEADVARFSAALGKLAQSPLRTDKLFEPAAATYNVDTKDLRLTHTSTWKADAI